VLRKYGYFREQFHETLREIEASKADAVVLIDYPGFNLRLARALRRQAARRKIIYYISPQVWAWNRGRIKRMALWIDLVLCIFPFEVDLYNQAGLRALFVGHPMIERLQAGKTDDKRDPNLIGLFPGSRSREVRKIFPIMLETARELRERNPNLRFEVAAASEQLAGEMKPAIARLTPGQKEFFQIKVYKTVAIMQRAWTGMVASGSATLEAAYFRLPFVLIYKVAWPTYLAARLVVNVKYLGMPNLLADNEVIPEFIQHRAKPNAILRTMQPLIENAEAREQMISQLDAIVPKLGDVGASQRAARAIIEEIRSG
jgi:lipid-A-disaccharide synthase